MTLAGSRILLLCGLLVGSVSSGCVFSDGQRTLRLWADYNTLKTPALFIEEADHLPYHASRIKHYRWMYNAGHGRQDVGMVVTPAGVVTPSGKTFKQIDVPVPAPEELQHTPQRTPPPEQPPLPAKKPPSFDSSGGDSAPPKPLSIPIPLKRPVPDGPSAVHQSPNSPASL